MCGVVWCVVLVVLYCDRGWCCDLCVMFVVVMCGEDDSVMFDVCVLGDGVCGDGVVVWVDVFVCGLCID